MRDNIRGLIDRLDGERLVHRAALAVRGRDRDGIDAAAAARRSVVVDGAGDDAALGINRKTLGQAARREGQRQAERIGNRGPGVDRHVLTVFDHRVRHTGDHLGRLIADGPGEGFNGGRALVVGGRDGDGIAAGFRGGLVDGSRDHAILVDVEPRRQSCC